MFRHKSASVDPGREKRQNDKRPKRRWMSHFKNAALGISLALCIANAGCSSPQDKQVANPQMPAPTAQVIKPEKKERVKFEIRMVSGLEKNIRYWSEIYSNPFYRAIVAENHSRDNLQMMDFSEKWPNRPPITRRANIEKFIMEPYIKSMNKLRSCVGAKKGCIRRKPLLFMLGLREQMEEGASRYTKWQKHVEEIFADKGLPPYLAALMIVESQCNPQAKSPSQALGPYQLIPWTIQRFNLYSDGHWNKQRNRYIDNSIDERRNWIFAAMAAAEFLENDSEILRKRYGEISYLLSSSAFHAGIPNLLAALKNSEKTLEAELKRNPTSAQIFAHAIYSAQFTRNFAKDSKDYPPQLYAAVNLLNNLAKDKIKPTEEFELIVLDQPQKAKLSTIVDMLNITKERFLELNPQYDPKMYERITIGEKYSKVRFLAPKGSFEKVLEHAKSTNLGKLSVRKFYAKETLSAKIVDACRNDIYCRISK